MKEIISEQEIKKFNYYGSIYTVHLAVLIISAVPLFMWLGRYAYIPFGILFIITQYWALKVEKLKKKNDIQTYKEIVAFTEGKKLDELHKAVEVGKRPYQNILKVIIQCGCYSDDLLLNWSTDALILELIKFKDILICRIIKQSIFLADFNWQLRNRSHN